MTQSCFGKFQCLSTCIKLFWSATLGSHTLSSLLCPSFVGIWGLRLHLQSWHRSRPIWNVCRLFWNVHKRVQLQPVRWMDTTYFVLEYPNTNLLAVWIHFLFPDTECCNHRGLSRYQALSRSWCRGPSNSDKFIECRHPSSRTQNTPWRSGACCLSCYFI